MAILFFDYSSMMTWSGNPTGIPRVVESLAIAFKAVYSEVEFVAINDEVAAFHYVNTELKSFEEKVHFNAGDILFSCSANWAYACYNSVINRLVGDGVRFSNLFYDVIPWKFPHFYEDGEAFGRYFGDWTKATLELAEQRFAISNAVSRDLSLLTGCDEDIHVIRLGDDDVATCSLAPKGPAGLLGVDNFILSIGTIEFRKNHQVLLNAYRLLIEAGIKNLPKLIIVGRDGWLNNSIIFQINKDPLLYGLVDIVSNVTDEELHYLYQHCLFTVFPSLYEGWGLPIAESLQYGKQCISSNTSSMVEIAPDLIRFAHPLKASEWADQIQELISAPDLLEAEGLSINAQYNASSWEECANKIVCALIE